MAEESEISKEDGTVIESDSSPSDLPLTCVICHESMEEFHEIISPKPCGHKFHAICMYVWLARHKRCPICREPTDLDFNPALQTLFTTALVLSHTFAVEQVSYIYAFLSLMLRKFDTAEKWGEARDIICMAAEQFELGTLRLPYLDLTSRHTAKKEKQKWKEVFRELTDESPRRSDRIQTARRWLIEKLIFMLEE
jgi:hypothetical protein